MSELKKLFRPKALERLSTPEQLDHLLSVASPRTWLPLLTLALLASFAIGWSVLGRIPITVEGRGILLLPRGVVGFQAQSVGRVVELSVRPGDLVQKGDVLARIELADLEKDIQLAQIEKDIENERALLEDWKEDHAVERGLLAKKHELQRALLSTKREDIQESLAERRAYLDSRLQILRTRVGETRALAERTRTASMEFVAEKRRLLEDPLRQTRQQLDDLARRLEVLRNLRKAERIPEDDVLNADRNRNEVMTRLVSLEQDWEKLASDEAEIERVFLERANQVHDVEIEIDRIEVEKRELVEKEQGFREIEIEEQKLEQEEAELSMKQEQRNREIERKIARLEVSREKEGWVLAEHEGRILELHATTGQLVSQGQALGTLSIGGEATSASLECLAYFTVDDGKRIEPSMVVHVTPDVVKRERFGSIVGRVREVSPYPVSTDGVTALVGNREVAGRLTQGGRQIEVLLQLSRVPGTSSGFEWTTSSGPDLAISNGTTAGVRVAVEQRRPISFLVPFLRSLEGE